jgi:hypothetical protein
MIMTSKVIFAIATMRIFREFSTIETGRKVNTPVALSAVSSVRVRRPERPGDVSQTSIIVTATVILASPSILNAAPTVLFDASYVPA